MDIFDSLAKYHSAGPAAEPQSAPAMDAAPSDGFADLRAAVSADAAINWQELAHPRAMKGSGHGGEFTKKPETLLREDSRDNLSKAEGAPAIATSVERGIEDVVKAAAPVGTSAHANTFTERGKSYVACRLVKNDRERFTAAELAKMAKALQESGCDMVETETDSDRANEAVIFCTPPVDPGSAAEAYMSEVEKLADASGDDSVYAYQPSEEAMASAAEMAKNVDAQNPAKRIRVDFQEWSYEDGLKGEPSVVGKEEDSTDGKVFPDAAAAAKWLLKTKNAGSLEGDPAWFSTVTQEGGKWKTYRLTPVNFSAEEILDIDRLVQKGAKSN